MKIFVGLFQILNPLRVHSHDIALAKQLGINEAGNVRGHGAELDPVGAICGVKQRQFKGGRLQSVTIEFEQGGGGHKRGNPAPPQGGQQLRNSLLIRARRDGFSDSQKIICKASLDFESPLSGANLEAIKRAAIKIDHRRAPPVFGRSRQILEQPPVRDKNITGFCHADVNIIGQRGCRPDLDRKTVRSSFDLNPGARRFQPERFGTLNQDLVRSEFIIRAQGSHGVDEGTDRRLLGGVLGFYQSPGVILLFRAKTIGAAAKNDFKSGHVVGPHLGKYPGWKTSLRRIGKPAIDQADEKKENDRRTGQPPCYSCIHRGVYALRRSQTKNPKIMTSPGKTPRKSQRNSDICFSVSKIWYSLTALGPMSFNRESRLTSQFTARLPKSLLAAWLKARFERNKESPVTTIRVALRSAPTA